MILKKISNVKFSLNDQVYNLKPNNGLNFLHGGEKGFQNRLWEVLDHSASKSISDISPKSRAYLL